MSNNEIENKVRQAFSHLTPPDVLESVLSDCQARKPQEEKGRVISMTKIKKTASWAKWTAGIAAALILLVGGVLGYNYYLDHSISSTVSLDVNPSIEIQVNQRERVLDVIPLNEDAQIIVGNMDFRGSDLDLTVNALIGSMLRNGYLSEIANSILVSVDSKDTAAGEALQQRLSEEINDYLQTNNFSGAVISQTVAVNAEQQKLADKYGVTVGKVRLIQQVVEKDPRYTFDNLAALSINELNLLLTSDAANPAEKEINTVGSASDKAYIGEAKAKTAALSHAGLQESAVGRYQIEFDYEHGVMVYEIEFIADGYKYEYDVNAITGEIVSHTKEMDDDWESTAQQGSTNSTDYIGEEKAKTIALNHAGLNKSDVTFVTCKLDYDDGRAEYEVEFLSGNTEYDYEIDAVSGKVLSYDHDADNYEALPQSTNSGTTGSIDSATAKSNIGEEKAKAIALNHAGLNKSDVTFVTCKLDYDDGRAEYEIEFLSGNTEYDYEIDAVSGKVLSYDHDTENHEAPPRNTDSETTASIDSAKAKSIAFSHAGVSSSNAYDVKCELDHDDGRSIYEVEFKSGEFEYDYEIDASSGKILSHDKGQDD